MTARTFSQDLKAILEADLDVPVFAYDGNETEELPCVVVGVESETAHPTLSGNFELKAYIGIITAAADDAENAEAETIREAIFESLSGGDIDCLDGFFFDGAETRDSENSTQIFLNFTAYTHLTL